MAFTCGDPARNFGLVVLGFHQDTRLESKLMANRTALIPKGDLVRLASVCRAANVIIDCEYNGARLTIRPYEVGENFSDRSNFDTRIDEWARK